MSYSVYKPTCTGYTLPVMPSTAGRLDGKPPAAAAAAAAAPLRVVLVSKKSTRRPTCTGEGQKHALLALSDRYLAACMHSVCKSLTVLHSLRRVQREGEITGWASNITPLLSIATQPD
jgi:hypothetical protein